METPIILTGPAGCGKSYWVKRYAEERRRQIFVCPCRKDRTLREGRQKLHLWGRRTEPAILWLEGADDLTPEAQAFLRRILETHAPQVQFILECRNAGKLQEPIRSRCLIKRLQAPSWGEFEKVLSNMRGLPIDEIREYLQPTDYSWRRLHSCIHLCAQFPDIWKQVLETRRKERGVEVNLCTLQDCIENAYDPHTLLQVLGPTSLKEYGVCLERGGSIWALMGATSRGKEPHPAEVRLNNYE